MKRILPITFFFISLFTDSYSRHIAGGEIFYQYLGPGAAANTSQYLITLRLFRDCQSTGAQLDANINIAIFNKTGNVAVPGSPFSVNLDHVDVIQRTPGSLPCIVNEPVVCYEVGFYFLTVTLPDVPQGYWITFQRCCRVDNITNLSQAVNVGATYLGSIAGTSTIGAGVNSSPQFLVKDTALVCQDRNFQLDFGATDPDFDSLSYSFCEAYNGGSSGSPVVTNPPPPPYASIPYGGVYSAFQPLGPGININPRTGLISGIAPQAGSYVIAVCVNEWRNGIIINTHRKDFILKVGDCDFVAAQLPIRVTSCDGYTVQFENQTPSALINAWKWDFGVPTLTNDTSNLERPTYTYPDTGLYTVKMIVNPGQPCSDSATMQVGVYPGFFPGFTFNGICFGKPTQFTDTSTTRYGVINKWRWDFGQTTVINDTSTLQHPSYTYPTLGPKTASLIVESDKGCVDTAFVNITIIDKPPITMPFRDTLICSIDSLQIPASGMGVFSWSPNYNIINANTPAPTVFPKQTTWYFADLDDNGCRNRDSVRVRVIDTVTLIPRLDTTSCAGDPVQLGAVTDGLSFNWTPVATLTNPNILNPIATPAVTTTYSLTAHVGNCNTTRTVTVYVVPYPTANAGPDTTICFNTPAQLNGSIIASSFDWSPVIWLNNPNTLSPVASPRVTTSFILSAYDTLGCPKPGRDTVLVTVLPKVNAFAGNDTAVVVGQPLQLNATGGEGYFWYPPTALSNVIVSNPVAVYDGSFDSIRYWVRVTDESGCLDSASLLVKIFKVNPQIFVPTGFTPNGDGLNDVVRPIAVGIERIEYFRIYNRWGQLVFSTSVNGHGWDGRIGGKTQSTNTFVWMVKAVDYLGRPVFQKGTVTLIR